VQLSAIVSPKHLVQLGCCCVSAIVCCCTGSCAAYDCIVMPTKGTNESQGYCGAGRSHPVTLQVTHVVEEQCKVCVGHSLVDVNIWWVAHSNTRHRQSTATTELEAQADPLASSLGVLQGGDSSPSCMVLLHAGAVPAPPPTQINNTPAKAASENQGY
jgi:hypothetical protein